MYTSPGVSFRSQMLKWASSPTNAWVASNPPPRVSFREKQRTRVKGAVRVGTQQGDVPCLLCQGLWVSSHTSPCHHGEPRKRDTAVTSAPDAELLLGGHWTLPVLQPVTQPEREASSGARDDLGARPGDTSLLPASSRGTRCHSASNSCPTGAEGLGLCCFRFHPRRPMGDEPLPGNKSPAAEGTSGLPVPAGALLQSPRLPPHAAAARASDGPPELASARTAA